MWSEGSINGGACIDGTIEDAEGKHEGFLNLDCEGFTGVEDFVQECCRVFEFEIFMGDSADRLNIFIAGGLLTNKYVLELDRMSSLREREDSIGNTLDETVCNMSPGWNETVQFGGDGRIASSRPQ